MTRNTRAQRRDKNAPMAGREVEIPIPSKAYLIFLLLSSISCCAVPNDSKLSVHTSTQCTGHGTDLGETTGLECHWGLKPQPSTLQFGARLHASWWLETPVMWWRTGVSYSLGSMSSVSYGKCTTPSVTHTLPDPDQPGILTRCYHLLPKEPLLSFIPTKA